MAIGNPFGDHEGYLKIINNTDNKGLFGFAQFKNPETFMTGTDVTKRCDYHTTAAVVGFHKYADGVCNCGSTEEPNNLTGGHFPLEDLSALFSVVDASPAGLILYFEFVGDEEFYLTQGGNTLTRTLQEQFRFLIEWEYAHQHLGNNEEIAICATEMLRILDLPTTIRQWILDSVPNEKVNRYLEGRTDARERTTDTIPDLTDEFKEWLLDKFKEAKNFGEHG